jgi:transcriptional regulator with XRE-family HTH domain
MTTYEYDISRLVKRQLELGLTDMALAKKAGLSAATVGCVFKRRRAGNRSTIAKMADAMGLDLADLVVEVDEVAGADA